MLDLGLYLARIGMNMGGCAYNIVSLMYCSIPSCAYKAFNLKLFARKAEKRTEFLLFWY